jgi:lipid-A-disaccharide synthase
VLGEVVRELKRRYPGATFRLPVASTLHLDSVREAVNEPSVELVAGSHECLAWADVALVASGTATLETGLIGTPFCLFYRVSPSSAWIFRYLLRYRGFIGMPNLLHGREVAREFFQEEASPSALVEECVRLIENESYRRAAAEALRECRELLGRPGASARAAAEVVDVLKAGGLLGAESAHA